MFRSHKSGGFAFSTVCPCDIRHNRPVTSNLVQKALSSQRYRNVCESLRPGIASQEVPGLLESIWGFLADLAVLGAEKQQGRSRPNHQIFDLGDKNSVVPGIMRPLQPALQISQGAMEHGRAMRGAVEAGWWLLADLLFHSLSIELRDRPLAIRQNIDSKTFSGMQMSMSAGGVVDTNQHQRWIKRNRSERVGGHAVDLAIQIDRDDRHSGGKASHRFSEFGWIEGHFVPGFLLRLPTLARQWPAKFGGCNPLIWSVTMFSVTSQPGKAVSRRAVWTIDVRATVLFAIAVVLAVALIALLHGSQKHLQWSQAQGSIVDTRIVADRAIQTTSGGKLAWKTEYKVDYAVGGRDYAVWADSGIRGEDEDGVRLRVPKLHSFCRVQYDPESPTVSVADCR